MSRPLVTVETVGSGLIVPVFEVALLLTRQARYFKKH